MKTFEVIIIGRGVTGLSTAFHLAKSGIKKICLIAPPPTHADCSSLNAGYASITLHDNISRPVHGQGSETTRRLLDVNRAGFSGLLQFVQDQAINHSVGRVMRLASTPQEATEMRSAVQWLFKNGFPASLSVMGTHCKQHDGAAAASIDIFSVLTRLEAQSMAQVVNDTAQSIRCGKDGVTVTTAGGEKVHAEMVVAACHRGIKNLIPEIAPALVNHADQWMEFNIIEGNLPMARGDLTFAEHSHFWMTHTYRGTLVAGGARFLRPWAGLEAEESSILKLVTSTVKQKVEDLFNITLSDPTQTIGAIDIRACDEIPIIGPMYGDSRILLASGFMGSGLTLGYASGLGLSEFIQFGQSKLIPKVFHPTRLRSLTETD